VPLNLRRLVAADTERVQSLTFPGYRHLLDLKPSVRLETCRRPIQPVGFLALEAEEPIGMVLGCVPRDEVVPGLDMPNPPELLSAYVTPKNRGKGVATRLVEHLEQCIADQGFQRVTTVYMTGPKEIEYFESLLRHRLWSPPETRMLVLRGPIELAKQTSWYKKYDHLAGYEFFRWSEISEAELAGLKASHLASPWIAPDLQPWTYDMQSMEPNSSIGIRYKGQIVGWVINHRLNDETVRFTCSFIRRDLARRARILPAYSESIRRASEAGYTRMMFTVPVQHPEMMQFAERWCAPVAPYRGESRGAFKDLASA